MGRGDWKQRATYCDSEAMHDVWSTPCGTARQVVASISAQSYLSASSRMVSITLLQSPGQANLEMTVLLQ